MSTSRSYQSAVYRGVYRQLSHQEPDCWQTPLTHPKVSAQRPHHRKLATSTSVLKRERGRGMRALQGEEGAEGTGVWSYEEADHE